MSGGWRGRGAKCTDTAVQVGNPPKTKTFSHAFIIFLRRKFSFVCVCVCVCVCEIERERERDRVQRWSCGIKVVSILVSLLLLLQEKLFNLALLLCLQS